MLIKTRKNDLLVGLGWVRCSTRHSRTVSLYATDRISINKLEFVLRKGYSGTSWLRIWILISEGNDMVKCVRHLRLDDNTMGVLAQ